MNVNTLLNHLLKEDIKLWVENGQLRYNAPKGKLAADLKDQLIAHKAEITNRLTQQEEEQKEAPIEIISRDEDIVLSFSQQRL